jgi:thiol:disulfide interchange protein DsbC
MKHAQIFLRTALGLIASLVMAQAAIASTAADALLEKLKRTYPNIGFTKVNETPATGIYEAVFDKELLYVEASGTYFFPTMVNMITQRNLGEDRRAALARIDFSSLPLQEAIKMVKGNGKRKMVVFADPNCGYCKRLESNLAKLQDVTVYTFPVAILGPDSVSKVNAVSCARGDRFKMWAAMMTEGARPVAKDCTSPQPEKNLAMFKRHGFQGAPAIIFESGMALKGYAENDRIEEMLAKK